MIRISKRYWFGKLCKHLLGMCMSCWSQLNFNKHGQGVCPNCRKRY